MVIVLETLSIGGSCYINRGEDKDEESEVPANASEDSDVTGGVRRLEVANAEHGRHNDS